MSEPSLETPLALPYEFYSGHAPTLRLFTGGRTASQCELPLGCKTNRSRGRSIGIRYLHMVDKPCTELPNPEAAVLPALVSVFDSEVTSLEPMMARSAWGCAVFRQAILSQLMRRL